MTAKDKKYLDALMVLAQTHKGAGNARVAAAIVYKNAIYLGFNSMKSHPFAAQYQKHEDAIYPHAEHNAIKHALKYLTGAQIRKSTLYIARAKRPWPHAEFFVPGLAAPCNGCIECIDKFKIDRVIYTKDE